MRARWFFSATFPKGARQKKTNNGVFLGTQFLLFTLFSVTMDSKYVKFGSKSYQKPPIYSESLQKIPLWANFSKTAPAAILKMPVL
jgi:hypothetical protein